MPWVFDVTSNIPRALQSGTDANLDSLGTALSAVPVVPRSAAVTVGMVRKPPTPTGFWYRCSTAGTTAASAPAYGTTDGGTTADGSSNWVAFLAPISVLGGTKPIYFMPAVRFEVTGTLTNANHQISYFTCRDIHLTSASSNFTSGAWASDGVSPIYSGTHFITAVSVGDLIVPSIDLQAGTMTLIGGEVQTTGAVRISTVATLLSYYTRWRSIRQWPHPRSMRFRSQSATTVMRGCELYGMAFDLFRMAAEFSCVAYDSEYLVQYVGAAYNNANINGVDAYFKIENPRNIAPQGQAARPAIDNFTGGYIEAENSADGANLKVTSQLPSAKHCVPLFQRVRITAKDTGGLPVQNVRFTETDEPVDSPTITITTAGNLKTWDFRSPLSYQATTDENGIALDRPVLKVWYYQNGLKENLRFPNSTAVYHGRAYGFKTVNVPIVLGSDTVQDAVAGMVSIDTPTTVDEAAALLLTGITLTPSGASGGTVTISESMGLQKAWNYWRGWISQFANRSSNDTWGCVGGELSFGAWNLVVQAGVTLSADPQVETFRTTGLVTNNGSISVPFQDVNGLRAAVSWLDPEGFNAGWKLRYKLKTDSTWTLVSGTGDTTTLLLQDGEYDVQVHAKGYERENNLEIITAESLSLNAALRYHQNEDGTPLFLAPFDSALADAFQADSTVQWQINVDNQTGDIIEPGFLEVYQAIERIQNSAALTWTVDLAITANATSKKIVIPAGHPINFLVTAASDASIKLTVPVINADTQQSADERFVGNSTGKSIFPGSSAAADTAGLVAAVVAQLGGPGYAMETHSLVNVHKQGKQIKSTTGLIPYLLVKD